MSAYVGHRVLKQEEKEARRMQLQAMVEGIRAEERERRRRKRRRKERRRERRRKRKKVGGRCNRFGGLSFVIGGRHLN